LGYFIFDVPRDENGEPIDQTPAPIVRCPNCTTGRMKYHDELQEYICEFCCYGVREDYNQTGLPAELEEFTVRRDRNEKPPFYVKSFSSDSVPTISEDLIATRGTENKKIIGSAQDALKQELNQFKAQRNQEHEDNLREVYNDTELNQGTENEILRFRAERERRKRAEENI
jgi:hypothetical protein